MNRVLGIWWLGNLLYPELYDYDMAQVAQEYYGLFWHYDLDGGGGRAYAQPLHPEMRNAMRKICRALVLCALLLAAAGAAAQTVYYRKERNP